MVQRARENGRCQTALALSQKTGLPLEVVLACLIQLEKWNYVQHKNASWVYHQGEFHLPKESALAGLNHQNWRNRAVIDSHIPANQNLHYTNMQTASLEDVDKLKVLALKFIKDCNHLLGPSKSEDIVVMNLDFFGI